MSDETHLGSSATVGVAPSSHKTNGDLALLDGTFGDGFSAAREFLIKPPERWGWEVVEPDPPRPSAEANSPPVRRLPEPKGQIVVLACLAWVGMGITALVASAEKVYPLTFLLWAIGAFAGAFVIKRVIGDRLPRALRSAAAFALMAFVIPAIIGSAVALRRERRLYRAEKEYEQECQEWRGRIQEHDRAEMERYETAKRYFPVTPHTRSDAVMAFGGSPQAWEALVTTVGSSWLSADSRVVVANFTRAPVTRMLAALSTAVGYPSLQTVFPSGSEDLWRVVTVNWRVLVDFVTDTVTWLKPAQERAEQREQCRKLLVRLSGALSDGPPSLARLQAALRVVMQEAKQVGATELSPKEFDEVSQLFSTLRLERTTLVDVAHNVEQTLDDLIPLARQGNEGDESLSGRVRESRFAAIDIDPELPAGERTLHAATLFSLLQRAVDAAVWRADTVVAAGLDDIPTEAIERLHVSAQRQGARLVCMLEHLRDDAPRLLGLGVPSTVFMRLGNHREASEGAEFIGQGERWKETQRTRTHGWSAGESWGRSFGPSGGEHEGGEKGQEWSLSASEALVREHLVSAEELMNLPETLLLFVEPAAQNVDHPRPDDPMARGRRRVKGCVFDPRTALLPWTATQPLPN